MQYERMHIQTIRDDTMNIKEYLKDNIIYLDGGMGTLLQEAGLKPGEHPEMWNISHPDTVISIHKSYFDAGSNVVNTNTFGANTLHFGEDELEEIIKKAIENAKTARELSVSDSPKFVSLDIGPTGRLLKPYGDLDFEEAVEIFAVTVKLGVKYGADLITIETMNDSYETKAALLAAKENSDLPVFVSNAYSEDSNLMTGASPEAMVCMLEGMGADAIGVNCSFGPKELSSVIDRILEVSSTPVIFKPNAGLPKNLNGKTVFDVTEEEFADVIADKVKKGVRVIGGCCGTTPKHIKALFEKTKDVSPADIKNKNLTVVSSYTQAVKFDKLPVLIGERINPTGKKRFKQALIENDIDYILNEGLRQTDAGVHILDVNVGLPDIDEIKMLETSVKELQAIINLPLQIDTSDYEAMERALRVYNGKALVNSVNGKEESMEKVFPLIKKYGGVVIALTLDETGIPDTKEGRIKIAEKILARAKDFGIEKKDIIFDTLAMTVSADQNAAKVTLDTLEYIRNQMGIHTSLGVSNVSFGLPKRDYINSSFYTMALTKGLSAAIMNPFSQDMMKAYYSYKALMGMDENCNEYIEYSSNTVTEETVTVKKENTVSKDDLSPLKNAIVKGLKEKASSITKELLKSAEPLDIISEEVIPALDIVGKGFEEKTFYLPQLLMSAEASKCAFEAVKCHMAESKSEMKIKCPVVLATVKGDIHDIGKNIVKLLMENYGFKVFDLGKDVEPQEILDCVIKNNAPIVGLSALMTTTIPAMEETVRLIREKAPQCKIITGGAVLNLEYAEKMGADKYAKDAMEGVRYADEVYESMNM